MLLYGKSIRKSLNYVHKILTMSCMTHFCDCIMLILNTLSNELTTCFTMYVLI